MSEPPPESDNPLLAVNQLPKLKPELTKENSKTLADIMQLANTVTTAAKSLPNVFFASPEAGSSCPVTTTAGGHQSGAPAESESGSIIPSLIRPPAAVRPAGVSGGLIPHEDGHLVDTGIMPEATKPGDKLQLPHPAGSTTAPAAWVGDIGAQMVSLAKDPAKPPLPDASKVMMDYTHTTGTLFGDIGDKSFIQPIMPLVKQPPSSPGPTNENGQVISQGLRRPAADGITGGTISSASGGGESQMPADNLAHTHRAVERLTGTTYWTSQGFRQPGADGSTTGVTGGSGAGNETLMSRNGSWFGDQMKDTQKAIEKLAGTSYATTTGIAGGGTFLNMIQDATLQSAVYAQKIGGSGNGVDQTQAQRMPALTEFATPIQQNVKASGGGSDSGNASVVDTANNMGGAGRGAGAQPSERLGYMGLFSDTQPGTSGTPVPAAKTLPLAESIVQGSMRSLPVADPVTVAANMAKSQVESGQQVVRAEMPQLISNPPGTLPMSTSTRLGGDGLGETPRRIQSGSEKEERPVVTGPANTTVAYNDIPAKEQTPIQGLYGPNRTGPGPSLLKEALTDDAIGRQWQVGKEPGALKVTAIGGLPDPTLKSVRDVMPILADTRSLQPFGPKDVVAAKDVLLVSQIQPGKDGDKLVDKVTGLPIAELGLTGMRPAGDHSGKVVIASEGLRTGETGGRGGEAVVRAFDPSMKTGDANVRIVDAAGRLVEGARIDGNGRIIDGAGRVVDGARVVEVARVVDVNGRIVDVAGRLIDSNGRLVDSNGRTVDGTSVRNDRVLGTTAGQSNVAGNESGRPTGGERVVRGDGVTRGDVPRGDNLNPITAGLIPGLTIRDGVTIVSRMPGGRGEVDGRGLPLDDGRGQTKFFWPLELGGNVRSISFTGMGMGADGLAVCAGGFGYRSIEHRALPGLELILTSLLAATAIARVRDPHSASTQLCQDADSENTEMLDEEFDENEYLTGTLGKMLNSLRRQQELMDKLGAEALTPDEEWQTRQRTSIYRRPVHMIGMHETLVSLAERYYHDGDVAWLIADLNKARISESWIDGKRVVEVQARMALEMPVAEDLEAFYMIRAVDALSGNLITIVRERQINREIVDEFLGRVVGPAGRSDLAPGLARSAVGSKESREQRPSDGQQKGSRKPRTAQAVRGVAAATNQAMADEIMPPTAQPVVAPGTATNQPAPALARQAQVATSVIATSLAASVAMSYGERIAQPVGTYFKSLSSTAARINLLRAGSTPSLKAVLNSGLNLHTFISGSDPTELSEYTAAANDSTPMPAPTVDVVTAAGPADATPSGSNEPVL